MLLDFISYTVGAALDLIPPVPGEFLSAVGSVSDAGDYFSGAVSKFGVVVPFDIFAIVMGWFGAAVLFWLAMLGLRLVLWIAGR